MSDTEKPWRDAERLRELYVDEGLTSAEIAERWGCYHETILDNLHSNDIPVRAPGAQSSDPGPAELRRMRVDEGMSLREIAAEFDVSHTGVRNWLQKYGIGDYETLEGAGAQGTTRSVESILPRTDWNLLLYRDAEASTTTDAGDIHSDGDCRDIDALISALIETQRAIESGELFGASIDLEISDVEPVSDAESDD